MRVLELTEIGRCLEVQLFLEDGEPSGSDAGQETEDVVGVVHRGEVELVRDL
jgi:hypothetical protein